MNIDFGDNLTWKKASFSGDNGGTCVAVTRHPETGMVGVRDTKEGNSGVPQWYTQAEWVAFLAGAKAGEFDQI